MKPIDAADVERFRVLVGERLGLRFEEGRLDAIADVLRARMIALRCADFGAYVRAFVTRERDELRALAEKLTINETYFFRHWDHYRAFVETVLPDRMRAARNRKALRVLSAGCASGEEPYSIAMLIRENVPAFEGWDITIEALDINAAVLAKAQRAEYTHWSLRETPVEVQKRYFRQEGRAFVLDETIRRMVSFEEKNLVLDDAPFWRPSAFDVIFCRNVMMYFSPETMTAVVARFASSLAAGGYLFLGHAETLRGISQDFHLRHTHDAFYYQRRDGELQFSPTEVGVVGAADVASPAPPSVEDGSLQSANISMDDASWVEVIRRASERIARLSRRDGATVTAPRTETNGAARGPADLGPALELVRRERFGEAMALVRALPDSSRLDPDALLLGAALLTNTAKLDEAAAVCTQILALDELNAGAHYLLALCCEHGGNRAEAIEHDEAATYLDLGFAMPRLHLGLLARKSGELERARTELGIALPLLAQEDATRVLLFGGGFTREALLGLCRSELTMCEGGR